MHPFLVRSPLLVATVLLLTPAMLAAGPVSGRLVDPDGRPVGGAHVLLSRGGTVIADVRSDPGGGFVVDTPDAGRFELRVAVAGLRAEPQEVRGATIAQDLGTIPLGLSAVTEAVVVSAAQVDVPLTTTASSVTVLTGEDLRARQVETLSDALRLVPGLSVTAAGGRGALTAVFPRGGESDYSLVLIDGVPANAFGGGFDFAQVPIVNVERIEIVRGPQSALYGSNAIGAVVRVITRRGGPPSGEASIEGGSFGTNRVTAGTAGSVGPWDWTASAERLASDGFNGDETPTGAPIVNDDYTRHSVAGGLGWRQSDGAGVRGDLRYLTDDRGFPGPFGSDPGGSFGGIDAVSRGENDRWLASLSAESAAGRRVRLRGDVSYGHFDGQFVDPYGRSDSSSRRTDGRIQADLAFRPGLDASAGVEILRERAGSTYITATGGGVVPVERGIEGVFAEGRWAHDARLFVTAGLRTERITRSALTGDAGAFSPRPDFPADTVISVNPKVAAAWFVRSSGVSFTKLRASAGTGIRPPDAFEIVFTDNPSLAPERSRSLDAGLDQSLLGGRLLLESTAFFNQYDDLIVAVGAFDGSSRYRTDNISNAAARGLEFAGTGRAHWNGRLPVDLVARFSYTWLHTEIRAVDDGSDAPPPFVPGDPLLRRPAHQFGADIRLTAGRLATFVEGSGRNRFLDVDPSFGTFGGLWNAAGYTVWSAGASWRLLPALDVFGRVTNLFDRRYEEALGFPALGRGAFAGLRIATGY